MNTKIYTFLLLLTIWALGVHAQQIDMLVPGLAGPIDVNVDAQGSLWLTEAGSGAQDGRVNKIQPDGSRMIVIDSLPSFFDPDSREIQGPWTTTMMTDGRIFVCQGEGPDSLSASIMEFHWDDFMAKGAPLHAADRRSIIKVGEWVTANGFEESNPYSFILDETGDFIISDAAANAILKYRPDSARFEVLHVFAPFQNPTPIGPPFVDVVPTKILAYPGGGYLVASLTGFPFLDGAANIYHVQADGTSSVFASGLTLITDMAYNAADSSLLALQFGKFGPIDSTSFGFLFGSAQVVKISANGQRDTLLAGFGPSPGMALAADSSLYLTHLFLGQLLKTSLISTGLADGNELHIQPLKVFPNPTQGRITASFELQNSGPLSYRLMNMMGQTLRYAPLGYRPAGEQQLPLDLSTTGISRGTYLLSISNGKEHFVSKVVLF
ncbi:MAG: ScyD/ScyE family protein [Bacteroidetes bacterium]|nr:MAG: ScyD/ScyE family protein [Bacteroidota bacterium]